jgi:Cu(I)/Ag(I) efflux system periplasmic protein CusF
MKRTVLALLLCAFAAFAQAASADFAEGEVRKVDKTAGTVIIRHGEIKSVNMGPMTMMFTVKPPALLDKVTAGDKVKFRVEVNKGDYVVTAIDKAK